MSKVFDYESSLRRMGDDQELFQEMARLLRSDAPPLLKTLLLARKTGDHANTQRAAHTLKGLAANFGAERAIAAAAEVEQLAKQRVERGMDIAIEELSRALDELIAALGDESSARAMSLRT